MERILKIVIDLLRGATYDYETKFTQADSQSHYLQIDFKDTEIDFSGVSMKVNFIRSDGVAVTTSKASVTSSNKVQIPTNALAKFGELGIEIILIKGDSILTVNKLIRVTVIKTLAGEGIDLEIGDSFLNEINQLTVNLSKVLTGEGDKQIERVRATGNKVVKQVESILGNNPEGGNAAAVGGLSRAGIETLIDNVVGKVEDGKFPLTSAEVGKVYEAVNGKKYKCIKAYSGSSLSTPNANFIEMSLNNHADRLDNLFGVIQFDGGENLGKIIGYKLIQDDFKKLSFIFSYDSSKANRYGEVTINIPNIFSNTNITGSICANDISSFVLDSVLQSEIKVISNTRIKIKITYQTKGGTIVKFTNPCKCLIEILEIKAL
ncbi:hypothetical protein [Fusobacterium mortiferum]|uniref:hypothetical protein n=1 Tax=Fusobacterium mortiferum TaxID=850 RepID=UPI003567FC63